MTVVQSDPLSPATILLERLSKLSWAGLPPTARAYALRCLMDNIGCGVYGAELEWTRIVAQFAVAEGSQGKASVFGGSPIAPARAALINGVAISGYELDDLILGTLSHPGAVVAPAALAMAEHLDASGDRLLLGLVAGYEMLYRLGIVMAPFRTVTFHLTGIMGAVAAAAAAAVVAGLPAHRMNDAVGIACSRASGTKAFIQHAGGMVKRLHAGSAAETGVLSCLLAQHGFTGPQQPIDGRFGLIEAVCGDVSTTGLMAQDLGAEWAIERAWTKVYPCCGVVHTAIQAIEELRTSAGIAPSHVKSLRVGTSRRGIAQHGETRPEDTMGAQYSLPFCAALAMVGDAKDPDAYAEEKIRRADVTEMIDRVVLSVDPEIEAGYPGRLGNRVEIELHGGERHSMVLLGAKGTPDNPCSDQEVRDKFARLCTTRMSGEATARLLAALDALMTDGTVAALSAGLRMA